MPAGQGFFIHKYGAAAGAGNRITSVLFDYGPDQNRWAKHKYLTLPPGEAGYKTDSEYQIRDAQGNTLATYTRTVTAEETGTVDDDDDLPKYPKIPEDFDGVGKSGPIKKYDYTFGPLVWQQQYLYGSSRLGQALTNVELKPICHTCPDDQEPPDTEVDYDRGFAPGTVIVQPGRFEDNEYVPGGSLGNPSGTGYQPNDLHSEGISRRQYELTNHLGNVVTVFGDDLEKGILYDKDGKEVDYVRPTIISQRDYLPFGLAYQRFGEKAAGENTYRYGFNGKEKDDEGEWGSSTVYDYGFRVYDPGIAKFLSVDPLSPEYPWFTPYQFAGNSPIEFIDLDGLEQYDPTEDPMMAPTLVAGEANDIIDAAGNLILIPMLERGLKLFLSREDRARGYRNTAKRQGHDLSYLSDDEVLSGFRLRKVNRSILLVPNTGSFRKAVEDVSDALTLAPVVPVSRVGGLASPVLMSRTPVNPVSLARQADMNNWVDMGTGKAFRRHELDGLSSFEEMSGRKFKPSTTGKGDFQDIQSGSVIDHFGLGPGFDRAPSREVAMSQFMGSVDKHFKKLSDGVDELLLDFKGFSTSEISKVKKHVSSEWSSLSDKVRYINDK